MEDDWTVATIIFIVIGLIVAFTVVAVLCKMRQVTMSTETEPRNARKMRVDSFDSCRHTRGAGVL